MFTMWEVTQTLWYICSTLQLDFKEVKILPFRIIIFSLFLSLTNDQIIQYYWASYIVGRPKRKLLPTVNGLSRWYLVAFFLQSDHNREWGSQEKVVIQKGTNDPRREWWSPDKLILKRSNDLKGEWLSQTRVMISEKGDEPKIEWWSHKRVMIPQESNGPREWWSQRRVMIPK